MIVQFQVVQATNEQPKCIYVLDDQGRLWGAYASALSQWQRIEAPGATYTETPEGKR